MKDLFPFEVKTKFGWWNLHTEFYEMRKWLENNIGQPRVDWMIVYSSPPDQNTMRIRFIKEQDAILFALRWS